MSLQTAFAVEYGSTVLAGLDNLSQAVNNNVDNGVGIGSIYPQFAVLRGQQPAIQFQSHAVASVLAVTGYVGADIDGSNNLKAYFAKMDGQVPATGSVHRTYTADRGVLVPRRLSCAHQQDSIVDCEALLYSSDGATEPIVIADDVALPSLTRDNIRHTLKSVTLAGVDLGCVTNVSIEFGNGVRTRGCNSDLWDKLVEQGGVQSVITITGIDADKFSSTGIPLKGKGGTHANSIIWLRKYDESGIDFVDDLTAEHIKIDAEGLVVVSDHSGQGSETSELTVQMYCTLDASENAPIAINTASAIS
jgi:hypothetical protein